MQSSLWRQGAGVTWQVLRGHNRMPKIRRIMHDWIYQNTPQVPERFLVDLFPDLRQRRYALTADVDHYFELPYGERFVLAALIDQFRPRSIFEFGTYSGATTRLLADLTAGSGATIDTLDLPDAALPPRDVSPNEIGKHFRDQPAYAGIITQHRAHSRDFDYRRFAGAMDFVFVDASHDYHDVLHDSQRAVEMLSDRGIIVWDDYGPFVPGVAAALRDLTVPVVRIIYTRLAIHHRGLNASAA